MISMLLLLVVCAFAFTGLAPTRTLRVLFVGNSLTYGNDLPVTFQTLYRATEPDTSVHTDMLAVGGAGLRDHLENDSLAALLEHQQYDVVVLQELGGWPLCESSDPACPSRESLREAVRMVRTKGSRPLWYSTWKASPEEQEQMSVRARRIASDVGTDMVDVGAAMQRVAPAVRAKLLLDDEYRHADVAGTWLAGALIVQAISSQPLPTSTPPQSCGRIWNSPLTTAAENVEVRRHCHRLTDLQWTRLRAAAIDARH